MVGLSLSTEDNDLETIIYRVLQHIGVAITGERIEECHRLNKQSDRIIVTFSRRNDCVHVMQNKKVN